MSSSKLDRLWEKTKFDENCDGDRYVRHLIANGKQEKIVDVDQPHNIELPSFYDKELFKRGQQFYHDNRNMVTTGNVAGVLILLAIDSILDILMCTRQSSTPKTAYRRYTETIFYNSNFYHDLPDDKNSRCFRSVVAVRGKHKMGSEIGERNKVGFINQRDMAITQFGFIGFTLVRHKMLAMHFDRESMEAFAHVWRVMGHLMGISEEFNLCGPDLESTLSRCGSLLTHIITPAMSNPPPDFQMMAEALINGMWYINPNLNVKQFIFFTRRLSGCPGYFMTEEEKQAQLKFVADFPHYVKDHQATQKELTCDDSVCANYKSFNWSDRIDMAIAMFVLDKMIYKFPFWKRIFNAVYSVRLFFLEHFPYLAIFGFGPKHAYVRVLKDK